MSDSNDNDYCFPIEILNDDRLVLDHFERESAKTAFQIINRLRWSFTKEGGKYWGEVSENLYRIYKHGK